MKANAIFSRSEVLLVISLSLLTGPHSLPLLRGEPVEQPTAVPTFECMGLYWKTPGAAADVCEVSYRATDSKDWKQAMPLWFDSRNQEYRGSIVRLQPSTTYEVSLQLKETGTRASLQAQTWRDVFPVARKVACPDRSQRTLTINESGSPQGFVLYEPTDTSISIIDVASESDYCIVVRASCVILRGVTLKGARVHAILLEGGVHDVVIENCDISGWGRVAADGWGKDYDAAIYSKNPAVKRIIIQRNRIHHPRSNSNNWQQARPGPGKREPSHPEGPQAVCLWDSEGNHVIRYNTVSSDDNHYYNDIFGAGENFSTRGFPNRDSDIYGNLLSHCWDDAIESEGANCNVRIWGNYITDAFVGVACASTSIGPLYVWRNVTGVIRESPGKISGAFLKTSDRMGGGRVYAFHNTVLQPASASDSNRTSGAVLGLGWGGPMTNVMSRNNLLHVTREAIADRAHDPLGDYDYDLYSASVNAGSNQEAHGRRGVPVYVPGYGLKGDKGVFALSAQSPGFDAGAIIPNFNDDFAGSGPDIGAHEAGAAPMEFGVDAYRNQISGHSVSVAGQSEGSRTNSILLNGTWEFARGEGDEAGETPAGQRKLQWQQVRLPGPFMAWSRDAADHTKCVWARRHLEITAAQARSLAVLRWNRIACGAVAFINGHKVGENEPTGPFQVIVPSGVLRPGENEIVLKIHGGAGVRKSRSGHALIPAGFGVGLPEVTDDVWIDFAEKAYMKWVLAMPDLANDRVKIRVTPTGLERLDDLKIIASIKPWPDGKVIGEGQAPARLDPNPEPLGGEHFSVVVPMPGFHPWTYEECPLYLAQVQLTREGRVLDEVSFRFGMREIGVKDRHYRLNGRNLWLRGSNLVFEWNWGDTITGHELDYLVMEAREMSMNSFRTHTQPPPRLWCDIGDEQGTMILAEFPVLYNYADYKFTPEEYEIWHRNCLRDAAGWMARLWNHPSVIMWVLSNESRNDNAWEEGPFQAFVNALDPTRPTLRTGTTGTKENYDVHACGNITETDEGNLQPQIAGWFKEAGERTTTCTEYMNYFGHPRTQWTGVDDQTANALAVAQIGAEHTEAMRRARLDGIWPYMYAGWTRTRLAARVRETGKGSAVWKANYAAPESAAWHSSLSPVLASLDLFDADYLAGQQVTTDLHLINDSWHDAKIHVDLLLTTENPEFIPEAGCLEKPVSRWSFEFSLKSDSVEKVPVTWKLPAAEGCYWLTARLTGWPGRPVLSQRFVRALNPASASDAVRQRTFVVLGSSDAARAFFKSKGLQTSERVEELSPDRHVVVIWNAAHLTEDEKRYAQLLCGFAGRGGRVVVLSTPSWNWPELCDVKIGQAGRFSRVFTHKPAADRVFSGIDPQWLIRWNGFPGTVGLAPLEGPAMAGAEKLLWARAPETIVAAMLPAAEGGGRILFAQLDLQRRVDPSKPYYDPAAERLLLSVLAEGIKQ